MICTQNLGHIDYCSDERDMDAILYFTGGIHFVLIWIRSLL